MDQTDEELMLRLKGGDVRAFETLYNRYKDRIVNFFYKMVWDKDVCEDLLQEVFIKLWRTSDQFRATGKLSTYIFQVAKNHWLNVRDKIGRRPRTSSITQRVDGETKLIAVDVEGDDEHPGDTMEVDELKRALQEAMERMPEKLQITFNLCHFQQLRYQEVAGILDIPLGTVKSRMANAEKFLRNELAQYIKKQE